MSFARGLITRLSRINKTEARGRATYSGHEARTMLHRADARRRAPPLRSPRIAQGSRRARRADVLTARGVGRGRSWRPGPLVRPHMGPQSSMRTCASGLAAGRCVVDSAGGWELELPASASAEYSFRVSRPAYASVLLFLSGSQGKSRFPRKEGRAMPRR